MEGAYKLKEIEAWLSEEDLEKLNLIRINQKLNQENYMLRESCKNFSEVENNLHRKIEKLQECNEALYTALYHKTQEFGEFKVIRDMEHFKPYIKALKVLDKYKGMGINEWLP